METLSTNTGLTLVLALSYGGRQELAQSCRSIAHKVVKAICYQMKSPKRPLHSILIPKACRIQTRRIRTSGEMRVSNFLLWQISYAEWVLTDVLWPDFRGEHLVEAIETMPQGIDDLEKYEDRQSLFIMSVKKESSSPDKGAASKEPSFLKRLGTTLCLWEFWFLASLQRIHGSALFGWSHPAVFGLGSLLGIPENDGCDSLDLCRLFDHSSRKPLSCLLSA